MSWSSKNLLTDVFILAGITALGYFSAFLYNCGRLAFYGLSAELIAIDATEFLKFTAYTLFTLFIILIFSLGFLDVKAPKDLWQIKKLFSPTDMRPYFGVSLVVAFSSSFYVVPSLQIWWEYLNSSQVVNALIPLGVFSFICTVEGVGRIIRSLKKRFDSERLIIIRVIAFFILILSAVYSWGFGIASQKTMYFTPEEHPNYLLIKNFSYGLLFVKFDQSAKTFMKNYLIVSLRSDFLKFKKEEITLPDRVTFVPFSPND